MLSDVRGIIAEQLGTDLDKVRAGDHHRTAAMHLSTAPGASLAALQFSSALLQVRALQVMRLGRQIVLTARGRRALHSILEL